MGLTLADVERLVVGVARRTDAHVAAQRVLTLADDKAGLGRQSAAVATLAELARNAALVVCADSGSSETRNSCSYMHLHYSQPLA